MIDSDRIDALVREGRHEEAAKLCADGGQPARAAELLAAIWRYSEASAIAAEAGLFDEAYRHAIAGQDRELASALLASLSARPEQAARAAHHAEARGRTHDAARLREAANDLLGAAALYEKAGELAEAARVAALAGDARRAGMLYERRLREVPDDARSAFELGQILARFGRFEHAARALQIAMSDRELRVAAGTLLVASFDALGMADAAQDRLDALRREQPKLPRSVPELLESAFGDPRGPRSENAQLLLGRYRVVRPLGAGGTGRVLLAEDAFFGRQVAIKVLHVAGAGASGRDALLRFAREAKVAAGIEHANVVRVFEYHPEGPYLVMEHMPSGTLEERLAAAPEVGATALKPIAPSITRHVARSVLSALETVHRRGVVHRDLKPANIFFGRTGEVKLGDFGVAHLVDLGATMTGAMMGTVAFMTPEQITGASRPDASTDLYALGVILYRCLVGALPFPGPDFVTQHLETEVQAPSTVATWLDARFDPFLLRLLEKNQSLRPRTASEVLESLDQLPWRDAEERLAVLPRDRTIAGSEPPPVEGSPAALEASQIAQRYRTLERRADGTIIAEDELLRRRVMIVPLDHERALFLQRAARVSSPFVQGVWSVDRERGVAILELPRGAIARDPLEPKALGELRAGLEALHRAELPHGSIDLEHIVLGAARAVLLLPDRAGASYEEDADRLSTLARLAGTDR